MRVAELQADCNRRTERSAGTHPTVPRKEESIVSVSLSPGARWIAVLAAGLPLAAPAVARAATLTVDTDRAQCPRAQFASIQAAVDNARPGDTVKVCAGTYAEQVTVDKPLTLKGDGATVDPLDGGF